MLCTFGITDYGLKYAEIIKRLKFKLITVHKSNFLAFCVLQLKGFILDKYTLLLQQMSTNGCTLVKMK